MTNVQAATDWTAIVGIVVAGVVGPALAYVAAALSDRRHFRHERGLKASDDLRERLDDVAAALEDLGAACAVMRGAVLHHAGSPVQVGPPAVDAGDAYQQARARIARLGMRSHAPGETVAKAQAAADAFREAIQLVREATVAEGMAATTKSQTVLDLVTRTNLALSNVPAKVETGYERTRQFETAARDALERLLGSEASAPIQRRLPWAR